MKAGEDDNHSESPKNVAPLRTILRNFINLVENCENRRNGEADLYEQEFQELKQFSESLKSDSYYDSKEGERSVNRKKNRYKDILPFDYSRVTIADYGEIPGSDYVNANFIKGASGSSAYIACQGPLPHTVNDFWRMVVECEVQVIVMACMEQESGKHKCENYWVEENGVEREFGQVTVWLQKCRNVCSDFLVRTMRIRYRTGKGEMEERNVCQFHYSAWPDHGIPTKVRPLLDMVRLIRDCQASETLPVLVHCSAGCGRTGTICAIDYVWGLLRLGKLTPDFSLFHLVREMRRQRIAMVQTKDQYILVHRAVKELFNEQLRIIDAHPYANVDPNGLPLEIKQELEEPTYATIDVEAKSRSKIPTPAPSPPKPSVETSLESSASRRKSSLKLKNNAVGGHEKKDEEENVRTFGSIRGKLDHPRIEAGQKSSRRDEERIETFNGYGEDMVDCSHFPVTKASTPSTSPNRGVSILRKPSIVKLKALFEKSPPKGDKDRPKKANVTPMGLSRAKSDVTASSRFYSFASPFSGSKGGKELPGSSATSKDSLTPKLEKEPLINEKEVKKQFKPTILSKPALPIKRSKSLKIHPEESSVKTSGTGVTYQNPIKVCVKHSEIPSVQSVPRQTPSSSGCGNDYEILKPSSRQGSRRESLEPLIPFTGSSGSGRSAVDHTNTSMKPPLPAKTHIKPDAQKNWVKVSKEVEDVNFPSSELKEPKYNGGTPKSALLVGSMMSNGCLSRSQSHVWQPLKGDPSLTPKLFSNEHVKSEAEKKTQIEMLKREHVTTKERNQAGRVALDNGAGTRVTLSPILGNPIARRRMPKVAAYSNYPIDTDLIVGNSVSKSIPPYGHPNGTATRETSSSSSSLPSTPTQSMDRRHNQDSAQMGNHYPPPPKSILKGSLSSTPSESDERLDSPRPKLGPTLSTSVVTISNHNPSSNVSKLVTGTRLPMGVRERRNSFRQAVWKEAQNDGQQYYAESSYLGSSGTSTHKLNGTNGVTEEPLLSSHRIHKDYEPIWPPPENGHRQQENQSPLVNGMPTVKNRIDDFKVLLEELRTPMAPSISDVRSSKETLTKDQLKPAKSPNLKYHRSLKAPSRSAYEQMHHQAGSGGMSTLSCFRKPTSLESIVDQLQTEDCGGKKTGFALLVGDGGAQSLATSSSPSHGFHSGRYANDYVTLEQCRTDPSCGFMVEGEDEVDMPGPSRRHHHYSNGNGEIPIPPPRTKAKRTHHNSQSGPDNFKVNLGNTLNGNFVDSETSPSGMTGYRGRNNSGDAANANSIIAMTRARAIGIFQDMKSKLSNRTEPIGNERTQSQSSNSSGNYSKRGSGLSNGSSSSGDRNGSYMRSTPGTSSSRSTSKHQYL